VPGSQAGLGRQQQRLPLKRADLGWGIVLPRALSAQKVAMVLRGIAGARLAVHGPVDATLGKKTECDLAVLSVRDGRRWTYAAPLHRFVVEHGLRLGSLDALLRALSSAAGDEPIAYLSAMDDLGTYSLGVLRGGRWAGFASVSTGSRDAVTVDEQGRTRVFPSVAAAEDVDHHARALAAAWASRSKKKLAKVALAGAGFQEWFDPRPRAQRYAIEDGHLALGRERGVKSPA
jgi:hypothetical protein